MKRASAAATSTKTMYRMRDLVRLTGLPRETIHFYIAQKVLPAAVKTGRNTALYGEEHLRRLRRIPDFQNQFLPLRAIREVLEEEAEPSPDFTPGQRALIKRMRASGSTVESAGGKDVKLSDLRSTTTEAELRALAASGLIKVRGRGRERRLTAADAAVVECWDRLKATGIDPEHGFTPEHLDVHAEGVDRIVRREVELFSARYADAPGQDAMAIARKAIPVLNDLIALLHTKKFFEFVAAFPTRSTAR